MVISQFFHDVLHAEFKSIRQSWGAYSQESERLYLRLWKDQIEKKKEAERVRIDSFDAKPGFGRNERRRHIELMRQGVESFGVVCYAKDPNNRAKRSIRDFDADYLLRLGNITKENDSLFVEIIGRVPVSHLQSSLAANWHLNPGQSIKRKDLHEQYGGRRQGGIGPSAKSPNVFLFTDPDSGEQHGYFDGWQTDGCFHYTGEGQLGDQQLIQGNLAILNAANDGRAIRLFRGTGGIVGYVDQFNLDEKEPFYLTDAPETGGGPIRSVVVFRLRPTSTAPKRVKSKSQRSTMPEVDSVPVEAQHTEKAFVDPSRQEYEAERRESKLVQRYKDYLEQKGHTVSRLRIKPANEAMPMFCDIYVKDLSLLIEAKGSTDRQSIRMAIGQLIDYRRFLEDEVNCAILLPTCPRGDLIELVKSAGMSLIHKKEDGSFTSSI